MSSAVIGSLRVNLGLNSADFTRGLEGVRRGLSNAGKQMQSMGRSLSATVTAPLVGLGVAMGAAVHGITQDAEEMHRSAQLAGAGFEEFQRLAHAARSVGVEGDKLADIYKDMNDRIGDFTQTGAGPLADFFENIAPQVGLTADAFRDLSGPEALQAYFNALEDADLSHADMTFYMEAIASDATALIPLLRDNGQAFRELGESAAVISDGDASGLLKYRDGLRELDAAFKSVGIALATSGILEWATSFVSKISELLRHFAEVNPEVVKFSIIAGGIAAAVGPTLIVLGTLAGAIAAIGWPVTLAVLGIGLLTGAVVAFWPEIQQLGTVIGEFLSGAWASFEAAWDGMVTKVHEVKDSIINFAAELPGIFAAIPGQMIAIGGDIIDGLWEGMQAKWGEFTAWWSGVVGMIPGIPERDLDIHSPSRVMHRLGVNVMEGLGNGMESMRNGVQSIASSIASNVSNAFMSVIDGTKSVGDAISGLLKQLASLALNNLFQTLIGGIFAGPAGGFLSSIFGGPSVPGFANGTRSAPGGLAWVGERGRELVNLPRGSQVIPNSKIETGAGGVVNNTFNFAIDGSSGDSQKDANYIQQLEGAFKNMVRRELVEQKRIGGVFNPRLS
ncbi:hypothetical protein OF122_18195 [Pelagibacterium flavum]|uniref:Phage tail tape measure protein n=1 Tax=Pelagibacterium flavum TaxID=2984530 RepID=A0ABY6IMX0_9HYPH|nr:hypothetical protein [Pelagibacterium sp. YIM 151497]UYQ71946.1 hypothetical protein OF122_18195 [Pelagibacterium sp. YIM 151497]